MSEWVGLNPSNPGVCANPELTHHVSCNSCQPVRVEIEEPVVFRDVQCGVDGTIFITDMGGVFACGSNEHNKLGLNNRQGFLMAMKNIFTKVG